MKRELDRDIPQHLKDNWHPNFDAYHSVAWWRRHWEKSGLAGRGEGRRGALPSPPVCYTGSSNSSRSKRVSDSAPLSVITTRSSTRR